MLTIENLSIEFKDKTIVRDTSAVYERGMSHALIGRNGAGKSTLLRAIAGIGKYESGKVYVDGKDIYEMPKPALGKLISFVNTERIRIPRFRCRDVVALGRAPYTDWIGNLRPHDDEMIERSLHLVGMSDFADRTMDTMSDGECQRVMIARALAQDTPVILLDEPTSFLDLPNRYGLCRLLKRLAHEEDKCVIYSSHELDIVLSLTDTISLIHDERIIQMPTEEMRASGIISSVFNI